MKKRRECSQYHYYLAKETMVLVDVCENVETDGKKQREEGVWRFD